MFPTVSDIRILTFTSTFCGKDFDLNVWAYRLSMPVQDFGVDSWNSMLRYKLLTRAVYGTLNEMYSLVNSTVYTKGSPLVCLNQYIEPI